ncbi:zinc finger RNA-binding protein [Lucilia sericata]|uniref:zinc finger RNA-binding protein n=1 Tax=Lucilia sericata TaxID=13632 RepID=UPI0018A80FFA|nr:zinc finger RNA-binding protein [Lucilia sericata]XP_037828790.1 zinc finger RNA-binding protein [Lucilia sericata]XP_037828870.1 zinc finger RNA-binding protein [Lucilia sericata]
MANNYTGFSYGGTQYNSTGTPGAYSSNSVSYPAVTNATYANAAAYQSAVAAGSGSYAAGGAAGAAAASYAGYSGSDYSRTPLQAYDSSKTFYQQAASNYNTAVAPTVSKTHYSAPPVKNVTPIGTKPTVGKDKSGAGGPGKLPGTAVTTAPGSYSNYDAALYSAASMYVAQQQQPGTGNPAKSNGSAGASGNWPPYRKGGPGGPGNKVSRPKQAPRPQQLHYCEVCKISCAGPQTYREHLEGQKHKKREASLKMQASAQTTSQNRGNNYHCELCDVTCTGTDAYAAHVRGAKHQKVVKLHQKLGKPIPSEEPKKLSKINFVPAGGSAAGTTPKTGGDEEENPTENDKMDDNADDASNHENTDNIKPVGGEFIEEVKDEEGKILSFNCKLCDCKFNDPNAKEMHMKGRRHRLQYKRKVQPDLVVDFKPTPRQRRLAEARAQRALMNSHRGQNSNFGDKQAYWGDEQRRRAQFDDEYDYNNWLARSFGGNQRGFGGRMGNGPPPFFGMIPGGASIRRPESNDDRHAIARHAQIYPKEEELQLIQRIVSHTERALKYVSDSLAENPNDSGPSSAKKEKNDSSAVKDGRDNQMLSFQKEADSGNVRILKGVMRVGFLAKGLLLQGDNAVELVVLCSEKPTVGLLKGVAAELPEKLKEVAGENPVDYKVEVLIDESAVLVQDEAVSVKISLTSPLLRESPDGGKVENTSTNNSGSGDAALLPREPCLKALAELRHAKWFQARATGLQSCVMVIRILRDLCQRIQSWQALPQWSMELLVEKVISSAGFPISPGDCLRRIMEALASGFLINGPGLLDPCEKEPQDALHDLSKQQREDLTVSAQLFLRYMAFRQIYKVLGMDQLPAPKFPSRPWRINRKRRRSQGKDNTDGGDGGNNADAEECASDEKIPKKDGNDAAA